MKNQNVASFESSIKSHFARVFTASDWRLFKKLAELNFRDAAVLLKKDMSIENSLKLLARNSRKRMLIGVGVELLLKAVYLKKGYVINKPKSGSPKFPFLAKDAAGVQLAEDQTFMLDVLIKNLPAVVLLLDSDLTLKCLKIAKVFRNKEGHGVTQEHKFDPLNYTDIATSLAQLYQDAFGEKLVARFSMAPNELPVWKISKT